MYTDTKKSYEQIIQTNITTPQLSSLHLKLRIQKDRLIAWGLEWADSNAGHSDDIDSSLDQAGISDLVASIMSSIKELLDEAERIQPQSRHQPPGGYPVDKAGILLSSMPQWTSANLARLEDIVRDITTSIDTLCDLSKSQQIISQGSRIHGERHPSRVASSEKTIPDAPLSPTKSSTPIDGHFLYNQSSLIASSRIDPNHVIYPARYEPPEAAPPSYNSTASDPGNRVFAFLRTPRTVAKTSASLGKSYDTPVLIDYYSEEGAVPKNGSLQSLQRFEDLVLSLQGRSRGAKMEYTGSLKILGWFADPLKSRYAFVYEIPQPSLSELTSLLGTASPPQSLLSYLQHSGDTDSSNVPCLEDRFRLALNLVSNLLHVHAKGLTHRNINSNNIVFVNDNSGRGTESKPWKEGVIRKPFLVSWDQCAADTPAPEPETLISNIYRPPGIERGQRSSYRSAHDVYSLGLVLLEIGMWMPLNKLWKTKYTRLDFKARLQAIYAKKLAAKCGTAYMSVVEYCLRAVDEDHATRASVRPAPRENQSMGQNDYYWSVLKPLERCCVMDASDEPRVVPAASASKAHHRMPEAELEANSPPITNAPPNKGTKEALQQHPSECTEWKTRKGFSPKHPGGIDLPVWTYGVDEESEEYFHTVMAPKIDWMADKAIDISESYELSVCMTGSSRETARPTILMVCKSLAMAWKILNYVNQEKQIFDIYVTHGQLRRSKAKKKKGKKSKKAPIGEDKPGQYPSRYQQKPSCGASIGCFVDEQHSEAVTFGGVVLVDGEPHGMSVHHMLEDSDSGDEPFDTEPILQEMSNMMVSFDDMPGDMPDPIREFENLPDGFDAREIWTLEAEGEKNSQKRDLLGTKPGQGEPIIVTQPALDDVDPNYFPSEDEMSDDHLVIHGFGSIHASSGLRRLKYEDVSHEIDWALFKIHDDRRPTMNAVKGGTKHCEKAAQEFFPCQLLKADALGNLKVHAFGSTSGLETGKIRAKMELTRMPGRRFASPVWKFEGNFGVGGDSGAWIIDNESGGLCGHVSSYSESQQYGVLAPMEAQLHDMEETLCAKVALPVGEKDSFQSFRQQILEENKPKPVGLRGGCRRSTVGSDYGSGSESEGEQSIGSSSPPESPEMATSPPPSSRKTSVPGTLSLNNVAEKWECAQASKRNSMEKSPKDGKAMGGPVHVREGAVKATC